MTVRVDCPTCGDVSLESDAITLRPCIDDVSHTSYNFICPQCLGRIAKKCSPTIAALIIGLTDVKIVPWFVPVELFEEKLGPAITVDDVIDFHNALVELA